MLYTIGIDASRNRSGGAKAHIIGITNAIGEECPEGVKEIHVWSYPELLAELPNRSWLIKHSPNALIKSIFHQLLWQMFDLPKEARSASVDIMLNTDAGTISRFQPSITMSRDMLSYEDGEMKRYGLSGQRLRLLILKYVQNFSLKNSAAAIFLTNYASKVIQQSSGPIKNFQIINHGISDNFRSTPKLWRNEERKDINCVYVSNVAPYKHQLHVAKAILHLRDVKGWKVCMTFVGGGEGVLQQELEKFMEINDPQSKVFSQLPFLKHQDLPNFINKADIFVFASSCENMPNTLIEGMCSGLPIACSNRGPMPEVLKDGGVYFDPEDYLSISEAMEELLKNEKFRHEKVMASHKYSNNFSWEKCALETFKFLIKTAKTYKK